jgi:solute carrier family 10 (sodium/bile acid cotransporter), member 7
MKIRGINIDAFLFALAATVLAAIFFPGPGSTGGVLHFDRIATYGIAVVFFLYGLTLAPDKLRKGAAHWRLHLTVQLTTFVLFPIVVFALLLPFGGFLPTALATGFLFLAALPSTVSSSVAMTSLARGNVPIAIFNATLSSIVGVFATPVLMTWFASTTGEALPLLPVITKIVALVLVPMGLGQVARLALRDWAARNMKTIRLADRAIILAIVYNAFSDSIIGGVWRGPDLVMLASMAIGVVAIFLIVYAILKLACRALAFDPADTIACLFCGSVKSLATGVPLARLMFGSDPAVGLIIAPIMLYHVFQLIFLGVVANRYARRTGQ